MSGIENNPPSVPCVAILVIGPSPTHALACAALRRRPGHKVRECTQAWDPDSPFVSADADPVPVDESNMSESATIIEDVAPPVDLVPELT